LCRLEQGGDARLRIGAKDGVARRDKHIAFQSGTNAEARHDHVQMRGEEQRLERVVTGERGDHISSVGPGAVVARLPAESRQVVDQKSGERAFLARRGIDLYQPCEGGDQPFAIRAGRWERRHAPQRTDRFQAAVVR
jgi:hypothetical protein